MMSIASCSTDTEVIPPATTEVPKPTLETSDTPMNLEIPRYSKDAAITIPYLNPLPEDAEVLANNENATILKYTSTITSSGRREIRIMVNKGIVEGKMIYRKQLPFEVQKYRYGFMNDDFSFLAEAIYTGVYTFEYGCAVVRTEEGYGVINKDGREVMPVALEKMPILTRNTIRVPLASDGTISTYNCYNKVNGSYTYSMKRVYDKESDTYTYYKELADGGEERMDVSEETFDTAFMLYRDKDTGRFGYRDVFGDIAIPPKFVYAYDFNDGMARVRNKEGLYGYIDESGELVIPYQYGTATDFEDYIAKVTTPDGTETHILTKGEQLHDMDSDVAKGYHEGLAAVIRKGETRWEYVDINGETAFPGKFIRAGNFSHGYAPVMDKFYRNYYIDRTGQPAFGGLLFENAREINEDGYAITEIDTAVMRWDETSRLYWTSSAWLYFLIKI